MAAGFQISLSTSSEQPKRVKGGGHACLDGKWEKMVGGREERKEGSGLELCPFPALIWAPSEQQGLPSLGHG